MTPWRVELAWWLAELPEDATVCPNPAEVESVHWLTVDEIRGLSPLLASNAEFLDAITSGTISLDANPAQDDA